MNAGEMLGALGVSAWAEPGEVETALRAALGIPAPDADGPALEVVDLTCGGGKPWDAEVMTAAGVVRVCTGQAAKRSRQPIVVVKVTPNTRWGKHTSPGGHWDAIMRVRGDRHEVVLTRVDQARGYRGDD